MKEEFIKYLEELIKAAPQVEMTEGARLYINALTAVAEEKPELTDNGKMILKYLQNSPVAGYKAKDIAEGLFASSRAISGAIRKLITDGFVEKLGESPSIYAITEKGKNYKIED